MAEIIEMPKLSDTMEEGGVANWVKKEGDFIEEGEVFVEIETDKATMEYNSPEEGYLLKILVPAGETCDLSAPICVVGEKGEKFDLDSLVGASSAPVESEPAKKEVVAEAPRPDVAKTVDASDRVKASPLAKKIASDKGLDIAKIEGSGPNGRIIARDVDSARVQETPLEASTTAPVSQAPIMPAMAGDIDVPNSMMRKTIAKRLHAAKNDAPHFYLKRSVNMTNLIAWRKRLNDEVANFRGENPPPKVSVNDLIVLASAKALMKHPYVNASWQGDSIRQHGAAHVAVAVAIPDGLITPVVRFANLLGARDIATLTKDLIGKAKSGKLTPDQYQGGTFSISNLGMMGIEDFTAIINPPQSAILAVGATIKTPWVNAAGEVEVQPRMKICLSCDHRVIDGAVGAEFLQTLTAYLEDPMMMLT